MNTGNALNPVEKTYFHRDDASRNVERILPGFNNTKID